jgi:cytochrome c biogenesis protein CcdA/thiol-disulfide isomerase/thioredoxin
MFSLAFVSFVAGILSILAPCVLPVLPLVLAGSIGEKNTWYPYVVTSSLALSIVLFTVLLKASTLLLGVPPSVWTYVSAGIIFFLGLTYLFPHTWTRISTRLGAPTFQYNLQKTGDVSSGFFRAILTGVALGPVFSSCSPTYSLLLATIFPVSFAQGIIYTLLYAVGFSGMLLIVAIGGQRIVKKLLPLAQETGIFRRVLGALLVAVAIFIWTGSDKYIEQKILDVFNVNNLEQSILEKILPSSWPIGSAPSASSSQPSVLLSGATSILPTSPTLSLTSSTTTIPKLALDGSTSAPWVELPEWIGSPALTLASLSGKVVIIDFWTYSCINCQRTLPYLVALDTKYRDKWLVIIGVHAPEFAFERLKPNVEAAVQEAWIKYPVVLDNEFAFWRAYNNRYWPAKYFIDKKGKLRHYHFGEGAYEETEKVVQYLLSEDGGEVLTGTLSEVPKKASRTGQSPETYLGTSRRENMVAPSAKKELNQWSLDGTWTEEDEAIIAKKSSSLSLVYSAKDVYLVMAGSGTVEVSVDGSRVDTLGIATKDSMSGTITVNRDTMYHVVSEKEFLPWRQLNLKFSPGVQVFAFTFGG